MKQLLNVPAALDMTGNEASFLRELLEDFLSSKILDEAALADKAAQNEEAAASAVHYIKGAARQLCAEQLAAAGQDLEDVLRYRKQGDKKVLIKNFAAIYEATRNAIQDALAIL